MSWSATIAPNATDGLLPARLALVGRRQGAMDPVGHLLQRAHHEQIYPAVDGFDSQPPAQAPVERVEAPLLLAHRADLGQLRGPCLATRCGVESIGPKLEVCLRQDQRSAHRSRTLPSVRAPLLDCRGDILRHGPVPFVDSM